MDTETSRPLAGAALFTHKMAELGGGSKANGGGGMQQGLDLLLHLTAQQAVKSMYIQLGNKMP
jgi:hypothetical protein